MADTIETWYYDTFNKNTILSAQQLKSKLMGTCRSDWDTDGEVSYFNVLGTIADEEETALGDDSPDMATSETRVMLVWRGFRVGKLISVNDIRKLLQDPDSDYLNAISATMGRRIDIQSIEALGGNMYTGHTGGTATPLPSGQKETAATGLTLDKIMNGFKILSDADVDIAEERMMTAVIGPYQWFVDLPKITEFKSFDYTGTKILAGFRGETKLGNWLGLNWILSTRLNKPSYRQCYLYCQSGMGVAVRGEKTRVAERADKNFRNYLWARHSISASRLENVKVVEWQCTES
jgi:hypothetical protein